MKIAFEILSSKIKYHYIIIMVLYAIIELSFAPPPSNNFTLYKIDTKKDTTSTSQFKNKIGIRTNVVDWVLVTPNIGIEIEVGKSKYYKNPYTISLSGKYNWETWHRYSPSMVYNLAEVRIEGRKYWRTIKMNSIEAKEIDTVSFKKYLRKYAFSLERHSPKVGRGYYGGVYLGLHDYSIKIGSTGRQGTAFSAGISGGWSIPLYAYRDRFIDLELGASIGIFFTKYEKYGYDAESDCYPHIESRSWHLIPYPIVSDVRLALVYRFESIRKKELIYIQGRQERINNLEMQTREREERNDSINEIRKIELARKDSIKLVNAALKDSIQQAKLTKKALKDSLSIIEKMRKDSIKQVNVALKDSLKRVRLQKETIKDSLKAIHKVTKDSLKNIQSDESQIISDIESNNSVKSTAKQWENIPEKKIPNERFKKFGNIEEIYNNTPPLSTATKESLIETSTAENSSEIISKKKEHPNTGDGIDISKNNDISEEYSDISKKGK